GDHRGGGGRSDSEPRLGNRVHERQLGRVKGQALERDRERRPRGAAAIDAIAGDRVTERRHVNADLMRSARLQLDLEITEVPEALENPEAGDRGPTAATGQDGHADTVMRMAAERLVHPPPAGAHS